MKPDRVNNSQRAAPPVDHPDLLTTLLTVPEIAERMKISRAKAFALIADGSIRSRKIGRSRRVLLSDLAAYIAALEVDG